ncbi:hypothetical protein [Paenibacillus alginolyticus]|uniref:DUF5666 domain-containing protein n=1 Tax=Paenibacillus alginolyticus TaxID=59839 RepID=A0ABT4G7K1_9BACL|nr:hypothetical protein [Paenibacillus alginolyticus]MCY9692153.1 hypothetical protein [Paenibacillus alginolyticus]MEC0147765.1 hypothetical protein [Paenibacillus alginolyticus]
MRKRLTITILSITLVVLMLCGWTAYAATSPNTSTSTSVLGTFKSITSDAVIVTTNTGDQTIALAKSVWVYRNDQKAQLADLKPGDQIELIVNSKQQAAYVKATSTGAGAPVTEAVPATPVTPEPTTTPAPSATSGQPAAAVPNQPVPSTQPPSQNNEVYPNLEDIDLKVDGKHFKLHVTQTKGAKGTLYDLNIKPENSGTIHLKGDQAAAWIKMLLASIDLKSSNAEQALTQLLAEHYNLDASKLNVHLKTKWEQVQAPNNTLKQQDSHKDETAQQDEDKNENEDKNKDTKKDDNSKNKVENNNNNNNNNNYNKENDNKEINNSKSKAHGNNENSGKNDDRKKSEKQNRSNHNDD